MAEPTPLQDLLVNDRYWLGRARGMLDQSIRGRDEAAARLTSGVGWLWTVYTGATLVSVALGKEPLPGWVLGVLVAPALLLVAAYTLATWAALPVVVTATVRSGPSDPSLTAALHRQPNGRRVVLVEGRFPLGTAVTLMVTADHGTGGPVAQLVTADKAGLIRASIPVSPDGQKWRVQAAWSDRQQRWTLTIPAADPAVPTP